MSEIAIKVENLSKQYRIGVGKYRHDTLRGHLTDSVTSLFRSNGKAKSEDNLWALKDVSFEVKHGEVIGIIGRNGAGKSTLLKILSRITQPTSGKAKVYGRLASLLEVGTGFHPELTGLENIYLNGAILGMRKIEIDRKLAEIIAFAEIERFIDTPVKRYSSGMYVRLAFAVAAHLEPEILMIDEVLAVGDAAFQKKCLGKIGSVAKEGQTVLFVSHNMGAIRDIASRGIWLHEGKIASSGNMEDVISEYLSLGQSFERSTVDLTNHPGRSPRMKPLLTNINLRQSNGVASRDFSQGEDIVLEIQYRGIETVKLVGCGFVVHTLGGTRVGGFNTYMAYVPPYKFPQSGTVRFTISAQQFTPGTYVINVSLGSHPNVLEDNVDSAIGFTVYPSDIYGTGYLLTAEDGVTSLEVKTDVEGYVTETAVTEP